MKESWFLASQFISQFMQILITKSTRKTKSCHLFLDHKMVDAHILVLSFPLQGHIAPLMKLSNRLSRFGAKVTFVGTDYTLEKMASSICSSEGENGVKIISFSDGLECEDDRKDIKKMSMSIYRAFPGELEALLNDSGEKYSGVIADPALCFLLEIPKKMGLVCATCYGSTSGALALGINIEKLVQDKVIDAIDGTPLKKGEKLQLVPGMPKMSPTEFTWCFPADLEHKKSLFEAIKSITNEMMQKSDWILCNWFDELDRNISKMVPNLLAIGPLLSDGQSAGSVVSEDSSCLTWLDKQSPNSVVYVAFGSSSRFSQEQIKELALGLENMQRPFLWVAWPGLTDGTALTLPDGFTERVANRAKIVEWAPQERVLAHPSMACFISHCGWGSFMESISFGVPLVCWPYFGDQMYIEKCICEGWKVGLWFNTSEKGIILRDEIRIKVEKLIYDVSIRANAVRLKEMARKSLGEGGSSYKSLEFFVKQCCYKME